MATLDGGRIGIAAQAVGIAQAAFDVARAYALERHAFGQRISDFQAIQHKLANMAMEIDAARLLVYRAAWAKQSGPPHTAEGAKAKLFASEMARRQTAEAIQILGGYGYTKEFPARALLPRREDHRDLRGHERDPAARDRAPHSRERRDDRNRDEPVRLTKIYTRGGDEGETSLGDGSRVSKLDRLVRGFGAVDELNSRARLGAGRSAATRWLERIQNELFDLGADLSVPYAAGDGKLRVTQTQIDRLELDCDAMNAGLPELKSFVLPGGTEAAARLHIARAACRRAEREVLAAALERPVNPLALVYLNRLSDLLFILARAGEPPGEEPLWVPAAPRSASSDLTVALTIAAARRRRSDDRPPRRRTRQRRSDPLRRARDSDDPQVGEQEVEVVHHRQPLVIDVDDDDRDVACPERRAVDVRRRRARSPSTSSPSRRRASTGATCRRPRRPRGRGR